jgi:hypothetical protein
MIMSTFKRSVSTLILLALVIVVAPVMLTTNAQQQTCPLKRYYLSGNRVNGKEVTKACREGFHTASLWELYDTSNLRYAAEFGEAALGLDKGSGPPTGFFGWVRTGWSVEAGGADSSVPGRAHCLLWTSDSSSRHGTKIRLTNDWRKKLPPLSRIGPWDAEAQTCEKRDRVWCIED